MAITKPAVRDAWCDDAMTSADLVDPGNPYCTTGWPNSSTPPSREVFNWLLNYLMNGIRYFSRRGVVDYDPAETYQIGDTVLGNDGMLRQSLTANQIGNLPSASPTHWGPLFNYATSAAVTAAINTALVPYETTSALAATLAGYVTTATLTANVATLNANITALGVTVAANLNTRLASYTTTASLTTLLAAKAPLVSPALTGVPTVPTAAPGTNSTQAASTAFVEAALGGASSLTANGYARLPGGFIMQWGYAQGASSGWSVFNITFPIAFPNACFSISCTTKRISGGSSGYNHGTIISNTEFTAVFDIQPNGYSGGYWMAVGH